MTSINFRESEYARTAHILVSERHVACIPKIGHWLVPGVRNHVSPCHPLSHLVSAVGVSIGWQDWQQLSLYNILVIFV